MAYRADGDAFGDRDLQFAGEATDEWSYTQIRDWTLLCEELPETARTLYGILRSMIKQGGRQGLRRMTVDQICWLLPPVNGKPASRTRGKDAIRALLDAGLLVDADAGTTKQPSAPRLYRVRDMPPPGYSGWRNAWDKLDAYQPDWRENPPQPPCSEQVVGKTTTPSRGSRKSDQGGRKNDQGSRKSDQGGRKNGETLGLTSENAGTKEALSKKHSEEALSHKAGPAGNDAGAEPREEREDASLNNQAQQVVESYRQAVRERGGRVTKVSVVKVGEQAQQILAEDPSLLKHLCRLAADLGTRGWNDLEQHLEKNPPKVALPAGAAADPELYPVAECPHCHGGKWRTTEDDREVKCDHRRDRPVLRQELTAEEQAELEKWRRSRKRKRS